MTTLQSGTENVLTGCFFKGGQLESNTIEVCSSRCDMCFGRLPRGISAFIYLTSPAGHVKWIKSGSVGSRSQAVNGLL